MAWRLQQHGTFRLWRRLWWPLIFIFLHAVPASATALTRQIKSQLRQQLGDVANQLCRWAPTASGKTMTAQRLQLVCDGRPVQGATLQLHRRAQAGATGRTYVRSRIPQLHILNQLTDDHSWQSLADLGYGPSYWQPSEHVESMGQWQTHSGFLRPTWQVTVSDQETGQRRRLIIDAASGGLLEEYPLGFHASAQVYAETGRDLDVSLQPLAGLSTPFTGYLDGENFSVFGASSADARAVAIDGAFIYSAQQEPELFDQVQTFHNLTRGWRWFVDKMQFTPTLGSIVVRTNMLINNTDPDNAKYEPATATLPAELQFGRGSAAIRNLARDNDVALHELSHHMIFHFIDDNRGTAAALHEGFADFFTYAATGDPNLGETILPGSPYLRTAVQPETFRFDNPNLSRSSHNMGNIWAAMLWDLRQAVGAPVEAVVFQSLSFLDGNSDYKEAIEALLLADRDRFPLDSTAEEDATAFGRHQCAIMHAAVSRGYAAFMSAFDGSRCSLDLGELALQSVASLQGEPDPNPRDDGPRFFGRPCAVVLEAGQRGHAPLALLLALPLAAAIVSARPRQQAIRRSGRNCGS